MPTKHIDFGFRVARSARRLRQAVDAELRAYGLTDATWRPLAYVGKLGGGVRQKELATALSIERAAFVRLLDHPAGRRAAAISLTRAGRDLAVRVAKVGTEIQTRALAKVPPADLEICQSVFDKI